MCSGWNDGFLYLSSPQNEGPESPPETGAGPGGGVAALPPQVQQHQLQQLPALQQQQGVAAGSVPASGVPAGGGQAGGKHKMVVRKSRISLAPAAMQDILLPNLDLTQVNSTIIIFLHFC